jgi:DNA helicase-2/ATP-dependent DNA helicase PcrA
MQQTTFQAYLDHRLGDDWELEDPFSQMEYVLTADQDPTYSKKIESIKLKSSFDYIQLIDNYISSLQKEGMIFTDIVFRGEVLISKIRTFTIFLIQPPSQIV